MRRYTGNGAYAVTNLRDEAAIILADDYEDADGSRILNFAQAQQRARGPRIPAGGYAVADAIWEYIDFLENDGRSPHAVDDTRKRAARTILPKLGAERVATLTAKRIENWHRELATGGDGDKRRAMRVSANRVLIILKAALNRAWRNGEVANDAWRRVSPFKGVDKARVRYLTIAEARRLLNACERYFQPSGQCGITDGGAVWTSHIAARGRL